MSMAIVDEPRVGCASRSYYDPTTAQFTTPDPLFSVTGSRYGYAGNDPVNGSDPSGLSWIDPCIGDTCASDVASGAVNATVTVGTAGTANCVRYVTCSGSTANAYYSAGDVVDFGARNRGTIATGIATGLCIVPGVGWASCAALQAGAYSVRAEQRVDQQGFSDSLGENLLDLGVTSMFFGVGSLPEAFGGFAGMSSSMEAFLKLLLSGPDIARSIGEACSG